MKFLILGAGATGGYFGARLIASGADVTFLVREKRAAQIRSNGLVIESPFGNLKMQANAITAGEINGFHDCVIMSCKSYDLDNAIAAIRPAMGDGSLILPLLNGMKHLEVLDHAFGKNRVLGGSCHLSVTLGADGVVRHFNQLHLLTFGARTQAQKPTCDALHTLFSKANFESKHSADIVQSMWDKWVLLASLAAITCLFRASVGEIASFPETGALMFRAIEECRAAAAANGHEPQRDHVATIRKLLTDASSPVVASMLRDMQRGSRIEAAHVVGDILERGRAKGVEMPVMAAAYANLTFYEKSLTRS